MSCQIQIVYDTLNDAHMPCGVINEYDYTAVTKKNNHSPNKLARLGVDRSSDGRDDRDVTNDCGQ
jgi:hypothetical protein